MDYAAIRAQVARCWYDTAVATAFRRALGLDSAPMPNRDDRDEDYRRERYWSRMMGGRIGALDRAGKR